MPSAARARDPRSHPRIDLPGPRRPGAPTASAACLPSAGSAPTSPPTNCRPPFPVRPAEPSTSTPIPASTPSDWRPRPPACPAWPGWGPPAGAWWWPTPPLPPGPRWPGWRGRSGSSPSPGSVSTTETPCGCRTPESATSPGSPLPDASTGPAGRRGGRHWRQLPARRPSPAQAAFSDCYADALTCLPADFTQTKPGREAEGLASVARTGAHHRKMVAYLPVAGDTVPRSRDGAWHGTHTAGSVAADYPDAAGDYGTRTREADGVAPAARLSTRTSRPAKSRRCPTTRASSSPRPTTWTATAATTPTRTPGSTAIPTAPISAPAKGHCPPASTTSWPPTPTCWWCSRPATTDLGVSPSLAASSPPRTP